MQTLGLSDSTPRTESRTKSLFWPTIKTDSDVEHITRQGFWIGLVVGALTIVVQAFQGSIGTGFFEGLFFALGGVGIRQRSRTAAVSMFAAYVLGVVVQLKMSGRGLSILSVFVAATLLANVRAIFLCARFNPADAAAFPRLTETIGDKLVNVMPPMAWPAVRWLFYIMAVIELGLGLIALFLPASLMSVPTN
jgi:hypothetical protein